MGMVSLTQQGRDFCDLCGSANQLIARLRDEGGVHRCRFALGPERRRVALAQAFHGGQVAAAAREFGLAHESILDFSSNLNVLAPMVSEAEWEQWAAEIIHYPEPDAETLTDRLAEIYRLASDYILPTAGSIEGLYLAARLFSGCRVAIIEPGFSDYSRSFATLDCQLEHVLLPRELWDAPAG